MGREWKPGDVALVQISDHAPEIAVRGYRQWFVAGPRLGSQHGWYDEQVRVVRPLLVIDPEDDDIADRLAFLFKAFSGPGEPGANMQDALRELLDERWPKPKPRCVAHGDLECAECSRISSDYLTPDGECRGCTSWGEQGVHRYTCPGRIRGTVYSDRSEAVASVLSEGVS